ncbi:short-chain dehydrogenase [Diplodia corticola]|uniref:Short-chain dehydrogenase n=1 Tax=Diplodia corticola TaxID=236234 RepID=A0A1J9RIV4_9PEZI|nr:short-chain dehydrogenase [Diplodia corticola]OJD32483.1 short-chain dehydrogenase [Diplodia corticola]
MSLSRVLSQFFWIARPSFEPRDLADQTGRVCVLTGGYSGIGLQLCCMLLQANMTVFVAGRDTEKAERQIRAAMAEFPHCRAQPHIVKLDLADLDDVRRAASDILAATDRVDVLVNNAGVYSTTSIGLTAQGHELHMGVNCLGPHLLTQLLLPRMKETAAKAPKDSVRILWAASIAVDTLASEAGVDFDQTGRPAISEDRRADYGQSKAANVFLAHETGKQCAESGIISLPFNPGNCDSEIHRGIREQVLGILRWTILYHPKMGALTELYAGWSPDITNEDGPTYIIPWGRRGSLKPSMQRSMADALDGGTGTSQKFWQWCMTQVVILNNLFHISGLLKEPLYQTILENYHDCPGDCRISPAASTTAGRAAALHLHFSTPLSMLQPTLSPAEARARTFASPMLARPVVRIAPNELSFATVEAHDDIHTPRGSQSLLKADTIESIMGDIVWPAKNLLTTHQPAEHKRLRNALAPAFTASALVEQEAIQQAHVDRMIHRVCHELKSHASPLDLTEHLSRCVWDIVGELSFGESLSVDQKNAFESLKVGFCRLAPILELVQYIIGMPVVGTVTKVAIQVAGHGFRIPNTIITKSKIGEYVDRQYVRKNFLTAIMSAQTKCLLSNTELLSNSALLVMVGYDTTATSLAAIFHLLLRHPASLARLQHELRAAYARPADITAHSTKALPFLNGCIQEAMRLFPPANGKGTTRKTPPSRVPTVVDGVTVPSGTVVSADMYTIQRNPVYWARPHEFRPERWLAAGAAGAGVGSLDGDDGGAGVHGEDLSAFENDRRAAHRPFLVGPRVCVGRFVATQAMRLIVAHTVWRFDMQRPAGDEFDWTRDAESSYLWLGYRVQANIAVKSG